MVLDIQDQENIHVSPKTINTYGLTDLGYKIFLDRYAHKDLDRTSLTVGDIVIVVQNGDTDMSSKREIAVIESINQNHADVITQYGEELTVRLELLDKPLELMPEQMQRRVAKGIADVENPDKKEFWENKFVEMLNDWKFVPGGRILTAAGTDQNLSSYNCFVINSPHDSRGGIFESLSEMAEIMSRGGGVGFNASTMRPRHAYVKGVNGRSSGAVSWSALFSTTTGLVEQSGSRRGALIIILNDWHPDLFEFIKSKETAGYITNANISVGISDKFMHAVKNDLNWTFKFPDTSFEKYDEEWNGNLKEWEGKEYPVVNYETVKAKDVWMQIIESAWRSAEPGLWFIERSNKMSNSYYYEGGYLTSTNPCVTGDTLVSTKEGYVRADQLEVGMEIMTPTGFKPIEKLYNNGVKDIYRVSLSDGGYLDATADHKLKVVRNQKYEWVAVNELDEGDKFLVMSNEDGFAPTKRLPEEMIDYLNKYQDDSKNVQLSDYYDRRLGFFVGITLGDGSFRKLPSRKSHAYQLALAFGTQESEWEDLVYSRLDEANIKYNRVVNEKDVSYESGAVVKTHTSIRTDVYKLATVMAKIGLEPNVKGPDKSLPDHLLNNNRDFLAGFLDGLFSSDGNVNLKTNNPQLRLSTTSIDMARQVRMILLQFGIHSRIYRTERKDDYEYDGRSMYGTGEKFEVFIMNEGISKFMKEIGISHPDKKKKLQEIADNYHFIGSTWTASVVSVEDTGRQEEVYDLYEPEHITWVTNGYVSLDCGEIPLPANGVCNLGALNLSKFVINPFAENGLDNIDWELFRETIRSATRFLDNVIDYTYYVTEGNEKQQLNERRVGLGSMGIAELMIRCGVRYGSEEGIKFANEIYKFIAIESYLMSSDIASEKGSFPLFNADKHLESGYMQGMPKSVREAVKKNGIRNTVLLTVAPTGCVVPDTLISTEKGVQKISDLGDVNGEQWQDIDIEVATDEGVREANKFYVNGYAETVRIQTYRGYEIEATKNHRVRVIDENGDYAWKYMDEISHEDTVVLMRNTIQESEPVKFDLSEIQYHHNSKTEMPEYMSEEFAELVGLYMGNGYAKKGSGMIIAVNNKDVDVIERIRSVAKSLFGASILVENRKGCKSVTISSSHLYTLLKTNSMEKAKGNNGQGAHNAFVPDIIMRSGRNAISAFIRGLFDADGSITRGTVSFSTTSPTLVKQVQVLLLGLGMATNVRVLTNRENSFGDKPIYELRLINRDEAIIYRNEVGFISVRKNKELESLAPSNRGDTLWNKSLMKSFYQATEGMGNEFRQQIAGRVSNKSLNMGYVRDVLDENPELEKTILGNLVANGAFFDQIVSIEEGSAMTYDLTVPDNHTYIANGFVSHNTTGTMMNTSTGIEPYFNWEWWRQGRLGWHAEEAKVVSDWREYYGYDENEPLPSYFVNAMGLTPKEHVSVMAAAQRWIDSAISKTVNCPNDYTVEQTAELYMHMYDLGAKGGTIYRDGSRDEQVLHNVPSDNPEDGVDVEAKLETTLKAVQKILDYDKDKKKPLFLANRAQTLTGKTFYTQTPFGKAYITINEDPEDHPFEVFITIGKAGNDSMAEAEVLGRLLSGAIQMIEDPRNRRDALSHLVNQMMGVGGSRPWGFGPNRVLSFEDAIAQGIRKNYLDVLVEDSDLNDTQESVVVSEDDLYISVSDDDEDVEIYQSLSFKNADRCPECGNTTLVRVEGCKKCLCGYSEC